MVGPCQACGDSAENPTGTPVRQAGKVPVRAEPNWVPGSYNRCSSNHSRQKQDSLHHWQAQTRKSEGSLRGFLGLAGYYRRFVKNFNKIAQPLTEFLRKRELKWSNAAKQAFATLKRTLVEAHVLTHSEYYHNTSVHSSTRQSPCELVFGRAPPSLLSYIPGKAKEVAVDQQLKTQD